MQIVIREIGSIADGVANKIYVIITPDKSGGVVMSDKESIHVQLLQNELKDCKALNKALTILAGEVSCVLNEIAEKGGAKDICVSMGEDAGRRLGKEARKQFGTIENVEEALDTFIYRTNMWYGYEMEIDHIEDDTIYINVFKCFIRDILRDRGLTTDSPLCGITRGYLIGALKELTGKDVDVELVFGDVNGTCRKKITVR
jgi:predicted hydrocarbon binding protein